MRVIQRDAADACLTGGAEFKVNLMALIRQHFANRVATTSNDEDPAAVLRPFDPGARGTVLGEGGGILIAEALDSATRRSARIYAEVAGFGATQSHCPDTIGLVIEPDGRGIADAIEIALEQAGFGADDIDAIAPLGSSIPQQDQAEAAAIKRVFGRRAAEVPLITTIPNAGNCNAGNGAIPLSVAAMCISRQKLPARLNTTAADGLDANASPSRDAELTSVLVFSTSQGGQNTAVVLKRFSNGA
jgi:3-oxoacyl-[acyl-carrier-protein] synthase II